MKVIGLIGGMSWESSTIYYKLLNNRVKQVRGGFASCKCLMYSVDFEEIEILQRQEDWDTLDTLMADAATRLYKGGADLIVLCTNTMHVSSEAIMKAAPIPFLHIADALGPNIKKKNLKTVGLLGTNFTMEKDFYKKLLLEKYGVQTIIPNPKSREEVHRIIYEELVKGKFNPESKSTLIDIMGDLQGEGAEGIILGCTEIPLLISPEDVDVPTFDTTTLHVEAAVSWALS